MARPTSRIFVGAQPSHHIFCVHARNQAAEELQHGVTAEHRIPRHYGPTHAVEQRQPAIQHERIGTSRNPANLLKQHRNTMLRLDYLRTRRLLGLHKLTTRGRRNAETASAWAEADSDTADTPR